MPSILHSAVDCGLLLFCGMVQMFLCIFRVSYCFASPRMSIITAFKAPLFVMQL
jgi:hypothetical protein